MHPTQDTAEYWRIRAEEVRAVADTMRDPKQRRMMIEIALGYERLAQRAANREAGQRA